MTLAAVALNQWTILTVCHISPLMRTRRNHLFLQVRDPIIEYYGQVLNFEHWIKKEGALKIKWYHLLIKYKNYTNRRLFISRILSPN